MKAVFFDRDGVVNEDFGYVFEPKEFVFLEGVFDLLKFCKEEGFLLLLVTNQSGIGRGYYTLKDFEELSDYMQNELKKKLGFGFDSIYFCPHDPEENCLCRKPNPKMIQQAKKDYNLDLDKCFIIGDKITDMQAGQAGGIKYKIFLNKEKIDTSNMDNVFEVLSLKETLNTMNEILGGNNELHSR